MCRYQNFLRLIPAHFQHWYIVQHIAIIFIYITSFQQALDLKDFENDPDFWNVKFDEADESDTAVTTNRGY